METTTIIVCFFVFLAGLIDSVAGGGGLISLPAYIASGLPPHMALGTNKFSSSFGTFTATMRFAMNGKLNYFTALFSIIFAFIGSYIGASLALMVDENAIRYLLIVAVPIVAIFTLMNKNMDAPKKKDYTKMQTILLSATIGLFLGMYDGFFGPGMGMFLILANVNILGLNAVTAGGNAKLVNLSSNLAAVLRFILDGSVMYSVGIPAAICGILGNYIGSGLAIKNGSKIMKPVMIVVMILLLGQVVLDLINA